MKGHFMTNKVEKTVHEQCMPASLSVLHSLIPHRCRFMNINQCHNSISRHPCCSQRCRDKLNTAQCQGLQNVLLNIATVHSFHKVATESGLGLGLGLETTTSRNWTWDQRPWYQGHKTGNTRKQKKITFLLKCCITAFPDFNKSLPVVVELRKK